MPSSMRTARAELTFHFCNEVYGVGGRGKLAGADPGAGPGLNSGHHSLILLRSDQSGLPEQAAAWRQASAPARIEGQARAKGGIEQLKQTARAAGDAQQRESSSPPPRVRRPLRRCRFTTVTPVGRANSTFGRAGGATQQQQITGRGDQRKPTLKIFGQHQGRQGSVTGD